MEEVVLVDKSDNKIGTGEKMQVHLEGDLHRAFSVFIFNSKNKILLQKRALSKYHSGGLWSNTTCGHPRPDEATEEGAKRRLKEEMGFDCAIYKVSSFVYKTHVGNGLTEHEFLHIFTGNFDGKSVPNPKEATDYKWISKEELEKDTKKNSQYYTPWFLLSLPKVLTS